MSKKLMSYVQFPGFPEGIRGPEMMDLFRQAYLVHFSNMNQLIGLASTEPNLSASEPRYTQKPSARLICLNDLSNTGEKAQN